MFPLTNASYLPAYSEAQLPYVLIALAQTAERIGAVVLLDKIVLHTCFRRCVQNLAKIQIAVSNLSKRVIRHRGNVINARGSRFRSFKCTIST
jgi:O-phosphoseryl-tRNA(Cys) synthetase